jgi:outer membrane protein assembly factor BamA
LTERLWIAAVVVVVCASAARADDDAHDGSDVPISATTPLAAPEPVPPPPEPPPIEPVRVVGFRVKGSSKLRARTASYLAHVDVGDYVMPGDEPELEAALMSSELFESAIVTFEDVPGGVMVVCTLDDKMSWIAAPTAYVLPGRWSVGVGYAESDLGGTNRKLLLYGQIGSFTSLFLGTYFDPSFHGTKWQMRFDIYVLHELVDEYANPSNDTTSMAVERESTENFLDAGALIGYQFRWWLVADLRLRGAYVYFRDAHDSGNNRLAEPEVDGWDWTVQERVTADHRSHYRGVTWGPYAQLMVEQAVPLLSTYQYQDANARAYYSWRLFGMHELELRAGFNVGRHLPFNEEMTTGGVGDLRGYDVDQFRGDTRGMFRAEYSVPIVDWRMFYLRGIGFYDSGYVANNFQDPSGMRSYLPSQAAGDSWFRNDVGAGIRLYVRSIVLPLLGFDVGYGLEARALEYYFELGLTDF